MKPVFTIICLLPVAWLTGCVGIVLPVPSNGRTYGKVITSEQVKFIVPGETARTEVIAHLGNQYRDSLRLPVLAYAWEKPALGWTWGIAPLGEGRGVGGYSEGSHWRAFFVKFDADQRVAATKFASLTGRKSLDEQLEGWAVGTHRGFLETGGGVFNPSTGVPCLVEAMENSGHAVK